MKVLIFGLPGAGKTHLAKDLIKFLGDRAEWFNADIIRTEHNDWDFSKHGRLRQTERMNVLADCAVHKGKIAICDFICPTDNNRDIFGADYEIFVDTVDKSQYEDTNKLFERPDYASYDCEIAHYIVTEKRGDYDACMIMWDLLVMDPEEPTTQMLGRFQPWHSGHDALFQRALEKTGQVYLMVRDMPIHDNNPNTPEMVVDNLKQELAAYADRVKIEIVPNITHISYGRDVGYKIEQEKFNKEIEDISATKIREQS